MGPVHKVTTQTETLSRKLYRESDLIEDTTGQFENGRFLAAEEEFDGRLSEEMLGVRTTHFYDEQGRMVETLVHDPTGVDSVFGKSMRSVYKYDSHGNETERTVYKGDGSVFMHYDWTFDYDSHGNWTKKIEEEKVFNAREDIKPSTLEIRSAQYRTISYH